MGYMHIDNLYRPSAQGVLAFKQVYCLEKIHGTSAHLSFSRARPPEKVLNIFSGGESMERFSALFSAEHLIGVFNAAFADVTELTIFGEAHGGKQQGMRDTYGDSLRFVVFDVSVNGKWLSVPEAENVAKAFGMEFVDYALVDATLECIDAQRDRPSTQATRNGVAGTKKREGVVIRPPFEVLLSNGQRCIAKHKNAEFCETSTHRSVSPERAKTLDDSEKVAKEWVTYTRLMHVLDRLGNPKDHADIPRVIGAMIEDVLREGADEVKDTKDNRKSIGRAAAKLYKTTIEKIQ